MKRISLNKVQKIIQQTIAETICLTRVDEFEEYFHSTLFQNPPDKWGDLERAICDYQGRIGNEICNNIKRALGISDDL